MISLVAAPFQPELINAGFQLVLAVMRPENPPL